jgi:hypothetical protein
MPSWTDDPTRSQSRSSPRTPNAARLSVFWPTTDRSRCPVTKIPVELWLWISVGRIDVCCQWAADGVQQKSEALMRYLQR